MTEQELLDMKLHTTRNVDKSEVMTTTCSRVVGGWIYALLTTVGGVSLTTVFVPERVKNNND